MFYCINDPCWWYHLLTMHYMWISFKSHLPIKHHSWKSFFFGLLTLAAQHCVTMRSIVLCPPYFLLCITLNIPHVPHTNTGWNDSKALLITTACTFLHTCTIAMLFHHHPVVVILVVVVLVLFSGSTIDNPMLYYRSARHTILACVTTCSPSKESDTKKRLDIALYNESWVCTDQCFTCVPPKPIWLCMSVHW